MKKTFQLTHPKIKYPRMVESTRHDIRKYIKRERRKELPEDTDFWDFDCRFGDTEADVRVIHLSEIDACISDIEKRELLSFYIEVLAKAGVRRKKGEEVEEPPVPFKPLPKIRKFGEE